MKKYHGGGNMSIYFQDLNRDQIKEYSEKNALILLPVGMIEQHGPHLPISTDNIIAEQVACKLAERICNKIPTLVLPCVWSGYHGDIVSEWPGAIRVMPWTLYNYVYEVCESLCKGDFTKIMIINAHGQNPAILEIVCRRIADQYNVNPVLTYVMGMIGEEVKSIRTSLQGGAGGHACEIETSIVLALANQLVDMSKAPNSINPCRTKYIPGDMYSSKSVAKGIYWSTFHLQKTPTGVLGDATVATEEKGIHFLELILSHYEELVEEYYSFQG